MIDRDHIRRVLSDGPPSPSARPAPPKLRQVEAPSHTETPPRDRSHTPLDPELRRRLEALGVAVGVGSSLKDTRIRLPDEDGAPLEARTDLKPPAAADDSPWPLTREVDAHDEPLPIDTLVGGTVRETPVGAFLQIDRRIPLASMHGHVPLEDALRHDVPLRLRERGPEDLARLAPQDAAFIDTETSGLAGGTGTVAFLVGAGWIDGEDFLVRQYFMRDYPEEAALLHALDEDMADRPLVSFNGRSFDWPLLTTRWRMNKHRPPDRAHLDLLPSARRLWGRTLHSHSLSTLERHVLGLERGEDLSGWLIPTAWFEFLRTGRAGTLAQAFRHNEIDVVSMLALFAHVGRILDDPATGVASPGDRVGTARLLLDLEDPERARNCLEAGVATASESEALPLRRLLGHLCRRDGAFEPALAHFRAVASGAVFDPEAYEQVAKILEHRVRDFHDALRWTRKALDQLPEGTRWHDAFLHREARLIRRSAT